MFFPDFVILFVIVTFGRRRNGKKSAFFGQIAPWAIAILVVSMLIGLSCSLLLYSLEFVTQYRQSHQGLIFLLPVAGLILGLSQHYFPADLNGGMSTVFKAQHQNDFSLSWLFAPLIFLNTLISHLVGASVGREGTAVQMGAGISNAIQKLSPIFSGNERLFVRLGMASGFAALFGTPIAGIIFALELSDFRESSMKEIIAVTISAFLAYFVCHFTGAPHTIYEPVALISFSLKNFSWVLVVAFIFGIVAWIFVQFQHKTKSALRKIKLNPIILTPLGGVLLMLIFQIPNSENFQGLGLESIQSSFTEPSNPWNFIVKLLLTVLALSFGFKGGEVTPLFFIGATLGSTLSLIVPLPLEFLAALGFVGVFAGSTKTFLACSVMGAELFGIESLPYFIMSCFIAQVFSGKQGIYEGQAENWVGVFK